MTGTQAPTPCGRSREFRSNDPTHSRACLALASPDFDVEIFDDDTSRKVKEQHLKDLDDAVGALGEARVSMRARGI